MFPEAVVDFRELRDDLHGDESFEVGTDLEAFELVFEVTLVVREVREDEVVLGEGRGGVGRGGLREGAGGRMVEGVEKEGGGRERSEEGSGGSEEGP